MNKFIKIGAKYFSIFYLAILLASCIYQPTSITKTQENRPSLTFVGGDKKSEIFINNVKIGSVGSFMKQDGKAVFVEEGVAQIKIVNNGSEVFSDKLFLSGNEVKQINLK